MKTVEELVFSDRKVQALFPESAYLFDQYRISVMVPGMRSLGQRSVLQFLNSIDHGMLSKLESHFGRPVQVSKMNNKSVDHYDFSIDGGDRLCEFSDYKEFCATRSGDGISVSFWR